MFEAGGSYRITKPIAITNKHIIAEGCQFILSSDAEGICGSISLIGCSLKGGEFYTDAPTEFGDKIDGSSVLDLTNSSADSCTIYSQFNSCIRCKGKTIINNCTLFGGGYSSLDINGDFSGSVITDNMIRNSGARYVDKEVSSTKQKRGIGIHLSPVTLIDGVQITGNDLDFNGHSGLWINGTKGAMTHVLISRNKVSNTGKCFTKDGSTVTTSESGTCIEVIGCPGAEIDSNVTSKPLGYNIAVAKGSHGTTVRMNICIGISGDPAIYVGNANDVILEENDISHATYGISVGEDGPADRCIVKNNNIHDNTYAPLRFTYGFNLTITGNTMEQYTFSSAYEGKGRDKQRDVCRIATSADTVFSSDNHFIGNFNALYTSKDGRPKVIYSKDDKILFTPR